MLTQKLPVRIDCRDRRPIISGTRKPIQLDVIDRMARVDVILGALSIRVHVGDQVLLCVPEEELGRARRTGIRGARGLITVFLFTSQRLS